MDELGAAQTLTALRDSSCLCTQFVSPLLVFLAASVFVLAAAIAADHLNLQENSLKFDCPLCPSLPGASSLRSY